MAGIGHQLATNKPEIKYAIKKNSLQCTMLRKRLIKLEIVQL